MCSCESWKLGAALSDRSKVLLSVRPRHASAILDGRKTAEVRRQRAHIPKGALAFLYASSPTMALLGIVTVDGVDHGSPTALWLRWGGLTGLVREEFDEYLAGTTTASIMVVRSPLRLREPIPLAALRRRWRGFVAPQSYRFVRPEEATALAVPTDSSDDEGWRDPACVGFLSANSSPNALAPAIRPGPSQRSPT